MEQLHDDLENQVELLGKTLEDKEATLLQAKMDVIQEYQESNALLSELGTSFANGFDGCLRQVKASFQTWTFRTLLSTPRARLLLTPVDTEGMDELFGDNPSDGDAQKADAKKSIEDGTGQPLVQMLDDKEETPVALE